MRINWPFRIDVRFTLWLRQPSKNVCKIVFYEAAYLSQELFPILLALLKQFLNFCHTVAVEKAEASSAGEQLARNTRPDSSYRCVTGREQRSPLFPLLLPWVQVTIGR